MQQPSIPYNARKAATADEMRKIDSVTIEKYGIPGILLMENAAKHVADVISTYMTSPSGKHITIICGKGNNGGDGFAAAKLLHDLNASVNVWLIGNCDDVKGDAKINLDKLASLGISINSITDINPVMDSISKSDIIVDGIFGTGFKGSISGLAVDVIKLINSSNKPVISIDIPSGLNADNGSVSDICVKADYTATFALAKIGLFTHPGAVNAGKVIVGDIGIPHELYDKINVEITHPQWISNTLPSRVGDSHKGTFGTSVVIAGSKGMCGAAELASNAVLRAGAGLSILCVPSSIQNIMMTKLTEVMVRGLGEDSDEAFSTNSTDEVLDICKKATSAVIGCGIGQSDETAIFARDLIDSLTCPSVIDADGLNCLSKHKDYLYQPHNLHILTPHPAELSRLTGTSVDQIQSDRIGAARKAASDFNCIVVLKGAGTVIAHPNGRAVLNTTGNPGMATGGTGDVLAGVIGGLIAQGINQFEAAVCGVYLHGLAGDIVANDIGQSGMIAGDILKALPLAFKSISNC